MSEKTEQPTDHRIRKAREDGQVAKSKDFTETLMMGALLGYTLIFADDIMASLAAMVLVPSQLAGIPFAQALSLAMNSLIREGASMLLPFLGIALLVGIGSEAWQTGLLVSFKALIPKGERLDPVKNLQQMFSVRNLVEFVKSCLKLVLLSAVVFMVIRDALDPLVRLPQTGMGGAGLILGDMLFSLFVSSLIGFGFMSLLDLVWQRHQYIKGLMMSMDEIRQEYKELEGDPHIKQHRKELAREIVDGGGAEAARHASVVVANPTRFSVALVYTPGITDLPVILAMGYGVRALKIRQTAEAAGVPVVENVPLARGLFQHGRVGTYIPSRFIEPVVEVLLAVEDLVRQQQGDLEEFA
ncbi:type III secretion system export apparatus subunit SctU [uncultured Hydrogenophaga sp.]|uniref:type III secretion system export apparatus subunit SctU n=1 Tax=uncultured Hydrogenophaga sp. TaxID=199683 RepID=UPI00265DDCD8|nr:type III secretion system export apparatus subunit SctU [uncultured Hydrogenophaga sp.]